MIQICIIYFSIDDRNFDYCFYIFEIKIRDRSLLFFKKNPHLEVILFKMM